MNLGLAGLAVAAATQIWSSPRPRSVESALERLSIGFGARTYPMALAEADDAVRLGEERVARRPQDWINQESLARALMARARLTGSEDDMVRAGRALEIGRSRAVSPSGPLLTSAAHKLATHRIAEIASDLSLLSKAAVPPSVADRAEATALRGDIALYSGRYDQAGRHYRAAVALSPDASTLFRLANLRKTQGDFAGAQAAYVRGADMIGHRTPLFMANLYLQRGSLALIRGDWKQAEHWFAGADRIFSGHWLVQAHRAQMAALRGDFGDAERGYLAAISSSDAPEVMDALAGLYRSLGKIKESRSWAARAKARWAQRLRLLPEAYYAHAAEHELVLGSPQVALDLARRNYAVRPYGDAVTLLGQALLANGQAQEAARIIEELNRSSWRTSQQYVVLAQAYAMMGLGERSEISRKAAERLNPRASDAAAGLIWFGHH